MFEFTKFIPELPINDWWFFSAVMIGLIILIALVIRFVSSQTDDIDPVEIDRQMLSSVRELTRSGEISEDEYRSIKGRLIDRLKSAEELPDKSSESSTHDKSPESPGSAGHQISSEGVKTEIDPGTDEDDDQTPKNDLVDT